LAAKRVNFGASATGGNLARTNLTGHIKTNDSSATRINHNRNLVVKRDTSPPWQFWTKVRARLFKAATLYPGGIRSHAHCSDRGSFLTSPLWANFHPQGRLCSPGMNFVP
jgi:hypothetical protein